MKYSLRSLMIVVLVLLAVGAGWLADHMRLAKENVRLMNEVDKLKEDAVGWRATAHDLTNVMKKNGWEAKVSDDSSWEVVIPHKGPKTATP